ncbi:MAG: BatA domain-containing protein [Verrucomicrobiota bacterium]
MPLVLGNPWGLLALLAIPVIILLHFLQQETRRTPVTTLFLLEKLAPTSTGGRRFEQLRNSLPLWLQILAALIIAWLLSDPRWILPSSLQRVVVVVDSSASMSAFRDGLDTKLRPQLEAIEQNAARHEWILMETRDGGSRLYSGARLGDLFAALEEWQPRVGQHDFAPAWRVAQSMTNVHGAVIFVTDTPPEPMPGGVELLAIGETANNAGLAGFRIREEADGPQWEALVKNYGAEDTRREFQIIVEGQPLRTETLELPAGETQVVRGPFPEEADRIELVLEGDAFSLDDRLPIVRPKTKKLSLSVSIPGDAERLNRVLRRLSSSLPDVVPVTGGNPNADLHLIAFNPLLSSAPDEPGLVFLHDTTEPEGYLNGLIAAEDLPLNESLNWQPLIIQEGLKITLGERDEVLLWQGERPLIFLRRVENGEQMVFNFDVTKSNLAKLPSFVILANRFMQQQRDRKVAPERRNVDTAQLVAVTTKPEEELRLLTGPEDEAAPQAVGPQFTAPEDPGFFELRQGEETLLAAAAQFSDGREASLSGTGSADTVGEAVQKLAMENSETDPFRSLWIAGILGILIWNWAHLGRRRAA